MKSYDADAVSVRAFLGSEGAQADAFRPSKRYLAPPPAHTGPFTDATGPLWPVTVDPWHTHGPVTTAHLVALYARDADLAVSNVFRVLCDAATDAALSGGRPSLSLGEIRDRTLHPVDTIADALIFLERARPTRVIRTADRRYTIRTIPGRLT